MLQYRKKKYFLIYESLERLVMYFIVAYYGCVGLIAPLGEPASISMREKGRNNSRLKTTNIDLIDDIYN